MISIKFGDHVRISKYKNIFAKGYIPNWFQEAFAIIKVTNTVAWTYVLRYLKNEEIVGAFYKKQLQKTIKKSLALIK